MGTQLRITQPAPSVHEQLDTATYTRAPRRSLPTATSGSNLPRRTTLTSPTCPTCPTGPTCPPPPTPTDFPSPTTQPSCFPLILNQLFPNPRGKAKLVLLLTLWKALSRGKHIRYIVFCAKL